MFNTFRLAADARRTIAKLDRLGIGRPNSSLEHRVDRILEKNANARAMNANQRETIVSQRADLAVANAKIDRMTSGLRRGAKKTA